MEIVVEISNQESSHYDGMIIALMHREHPESAVAVDRVDGMQLGTYRVLGEEEIHHFSIDDLYHIEEFIMVSQDDDGNFEYFNVPEITTLEVLAAGPAIFTARYAHREAVRVALQDTERVYVTLYELPDEDELLFENGISDSQVVRGGVSLRLIRSETVQWLSDSFATVGHDSHGMFVTHVDHFPVEDVPIFAAWVDAEIVERMAHEQAMQDPFFALDDSDFEDYVNAVGEFYPADAHYSDEDSSDDEDDEPQGPLPAAAG